MPLLAPEQVKGISERLSIAHQNILNLDSEITKFLEPFPTIEIKVEDGNPIITETERNAWRDLQEAAKETVVPLAFSIRAGEVIHHLRSCLDHIAWQLSDPTKRDAHPTRVEFPIITDWTDTDESSRYKRKTEFISDLCAKSIIEKLQPARLISGAKSDPLYIVHKMDIFDKHRELALMAWAPRGRGPSQVTRDYIPVQNDDGTRTLIPLIGTAKVQADMKISLHIAFAKVAKEGWEERPAIKLLLDLKDAIKDTVGLFTE